MGEGDVVVDQFPYENTTISENQEVWLYLDTKRKTSK